MRIKANPDSLKRLMWRLVYAKQHIVDACNSIVLCIEQTDNRKDLLFRPLSIAAIVSYAAPFIGSKTIGKLHPEFEKFADDKLQEIHNGIINGRNNFFAHTAPKYLQPVLVKIEHRGDVSNAAYEVSTSHYINTLKYDHLPLFKGLCDFQINRVEDAIKKMIPALLPYIDPLRSLNQQDVKGIVREIEFPEG